MPRLAGRSRPAPYVERLAPWEPLALLPSQLRPRVPLTTSHQLLVGILGQALDDLRVDRAYRRYPSRRRPCPPTYSPREDAIAWIEDDPVEPDPCGRFSFTQVCQALGIDPTAARDALRRCGYRPGLVVHLEVSDRRHRPPLC